MNTRAPQPYHRGSCLCGTYELRITRRCLLDDLNLGPGTSFSATVSHPIVQAFQSQRSTNVTGSKTVGPASGERTLYRLGHGHDHRGATWYDPRERVVWLCAYRLHRSGDPDDAFPYFHELIRAERIMPTEDDYEALFQDRAFRFAETLPQDAQALLTRARSNLGVEEVGLIGGAETTGVVVEVVESLEETHVALSVARMDYTRIVLILQAFYPEATFGDWELASRLPTRCLHGDEVCYRILRD